MDQQIVFIFVWKLFKKAELSDKINIIAYNSYYKKNNISVKFSKKSAGW